MMFENEMVLRMAAQSQNEAFARVAAAAFAAQLDPTLSEIQDIKTVVSEAVTNAIIHGYPEKAAGQTVILTVKLRGREVYIEIEDEGCGIADLAAARQPLFTSRPDLERSGMGFTVMETFMDSIQVSSERGKGTKVMMVKQLSARADECTGE